MNQDYCHFNTRIIKSQFFVNDLLGAKDVMDDIKWRISSYYKMTRDSHVCGAQRQIEGRSSYLNACSVGHYCTVIAC